MIYSKTIAITIFIASALSTYNGMVGMDYPDMKTDYPQLQLQEPEKNPIKAVNAKLQINSNAFYSRSTNPGTNIQVLFPGRPHRYIHDPMIGVKLFIENDNLRTIELPIPAKQLFNLNDGSIIQFHILQTHKPHDNRFITATCQRNPKHFLEGKDFCQQFEFVMTDFYKSPNIAGSHKERLLAQKVIKIAHYRPMMAALGGIDVPPLEIIRHGENGCPDEEAFIKSIIKPKKKAYGNRNTVDILMHRQLDLKPRPKLTSDPNRILDNCLRMMELAMMADHNLLDECFREFVAHCLLTRLFINDRIARLFIEFFKKNNEHS